MGASCEVKIPRKSRPYYHVTQEEYQAQMRILQRHYPGRDLNLESLRSILEDIDRDIASDEGTGRSSTTTGTPEGTPNDETKQPEALELDSEVLDVMHKEIAGCLMKDSIGKFRYIGAYSEIPFNDAVCCTNVDRTFMLDGSKLIDSPQKHKHLLPPGLDAKRIDMKPVPYLPPRAYCDYYVARFFEDVHCTYWLFPIEDFTARLDEMYKTNKATSNSYLCGIYAISALGAASSSGKVWDKMISGKPKGAADTKSPLDYLALARGLVPLAMQEESDMNAIRALAVLSMALQSSGFKLAAWLQLGVCVQIAHSLGVSNDQLASCTNPVDREMNRRIWWSLYVMDHNLGSFGGSSFLIDEMHIPMPSDVLVGPSPNSPLGCFQQHISLCLIKREIIDSIYPRHKPVSRTVTSSTISTFISYLQKWLSDLPAHLSISSAKSSSQSNHRRAIYLLHLDYQACLILLTRTFLLYLVRHHPGLTSPTPGNKKCACICSLGDKCTAAAQDSLKILKAMSEEGILSSLTVHDSGWILKVVIISLLSFRRTKNQQFRSDIETCKGILAGMEHIGFCKNVIDELPAQLDALGITSIPMQSDEEDVGSGSAFAAPGEDVISQQFVDFETYFFDTFDDSFLVNMELDADFPHGLGSPANLALYPAEGLGGT
eukprot:GHVU01120931.1.p1 GENE.GHVU01120931.1~~GHVU01120931.1.p1  ORF type:complete len:659 (-),score=33.39 GHVU01120931.1:414-2390(-)